MLDGTHGHLTRHLVNAAPRLVGRHVGYPGYGLVHLGLAGVVVQPELVLSQEAPRRGVSDGVTIAKEAQVTLAQRLAVFEGLAVLGVLVPEQPQRVTADAQGDRRRVVGKVLAAQEANLLDQLRVARVELRPRLVLEPIEPERLLLRLGELVASIVVCHGRPWPVRG